MKNKLNKLIITLLSIGVLFTAVPILAYNEPAESELKPLMMGRTQGTGTHFEITDSEYLNISLQSAEEITIDLESMPKMISMDISSSTDSFSFNLFLSGLEPNTTYYKYQDSYKAKVVFVSNENGKYNWTQDLTLSHHIWIQPGIDKRVQSQDTQTKSESDGIVFLPEDCSDYGIWDEQTLTCVLNQDLHESIEITANNITLDCAGHSLTGADTGYGVYINRKTNVTVKNCNVNNFSYGICVGYSHSNILINNTISNNWAYGINLGYSSNNKILDNIISSSGWQGIRTIGAQDNLIKNNSISFNARGIDIEKSVLDPPGMIEVSRNTIIENTISSNRGAGILVTFCSDNYVYHNNFINNNTNWPGSYQGYQQPSGFWDNGYPSGGNYWSDYTGIDEKSGPNQDEPGSDNIGDTSYSFYHGNKRDTDRYPFMEQSGWKESTSTTYNVAVILAEPSDVPHISSSITEQPCKLIPEKTYPNGHGKEYYQDLAYCVADYHRENSFGTVNLDFEIFDNDGEWFEVIEEGDFIEKSIELVKSKGIDLFDYNIIIVAKAKESVKGGEDAFQRVIVDKSTGKVIEFSKIKVGENDPMGVWTHEITHFIGADITPHNTPTPDLYDVGDVEKWDLMAEGAFNGGLGDISSFREDGSNPCYMSSYTKEFLQWLDYDIHPKSAYGEYWINSLETSNLGDTIFRYNLSDDTDDKSEKYYILEARNRDLKTWDSSLLGLTSKHLILYYVDSKSFKKYGYNLDKQKMAIRDWIVTIPGNNPNNTLLAINDGILNPLINETYRDFDELVKFTAKTNRTINDKYEIQAEIDEIAYDSFADKFWGVVLKPDSLFKEKIKGDFVLESYLTAQLESNESAQTTIAEQRLIPPSREYYQEGAMGIFWGMIFPLLLLNLFLICLNKIIGRWKLEKLKKIIKIFIKLLWIVIIIISIVIIVLFIYSFNKEPKSELMRQHRENSIRFIEQELLPLRSKTTSPDLDLHLHCDDGRHIGMNYTTGEYEIGIPEAIVSGDNQGSPEWILIPPEIENCHFIVSSYDNQKFLEENPKIAQKMENTMDSYEIYARYIDPETAIYTSDVVLEEQIEPGQELEHSITGTTDIAVLQAILWQTPRYFKEQSIIFLEGSKTNNKAIDREIDSIIRHIDNSLDDTLWIDNFRLDSRQGRRALSEQSFAVRRLYHKSCIFNRKISILERIIEIKQKFQLDTAKEQAEIEAINSILPVFNQVVDNLIKADKIIAETAIYDAKNTPVENPRFQNTVNRFIEKAERELLKAEKEISKNRPDKAITRLTQSWSYSQFAIRFAAPSFHNPYTFDLQTQFLGALNSFLYPCW